MTEQNKEYINILSAATVFCSRYTQDESDTINQSIFTKWWSKFFKPVPNDEWLLLFGLCCLNMTDAASSNSDATDPGLDLILPLAACRPQDKAPPLNSTASVYVCENDCTGCTWTVTFTMAAKSRRYDMGKTQTKESRATHSIRPQNQSHDEEQCYCIESKMVFGTHRRKCGVRRSPITQSWQERQIRAYPKNVNLPVLGQGNLPLNRLQLLSSEERGRKREKDIWNQQLCGPYPRAADSVTPLPLWQRTASLHENSYTLFPSFTLILPVISPPFSNRLDFLTRYICAADIMWKVE